MSELPKAPSLDDSLRSITPEVAGRYRLADGRPVDAAGEDGRVELGRGGIGRVLLAFDEHLGREVALKELLPVPAERREMILARFLREARVTGQLEHPGIVPVHELGRRADGTPYYTMRMVRGRTLEEALCACRGLADRLRLLTHFVDLCQALGYAHSRGVIHRDVKPANVMLGEFGETVVLDWGLAKVRGRRDERGPELAREIRLLGADSRSTQAGSALGTPAYMSPEAALGDIEALDARSDVWGLGAVLFEILTGRPPFLGASAWDVLAQVLRRPAPPVRATCAEAPAELASVCEKALSREPGRRYPGAAELAAEVQAYLTGGRVRAYDYRPWEILRRWAGRHRAVLATGALALILLLALGVVSYLQVRAGLRLAERNLAESLREGARAALARGDPLEARAKLRTALELDDTLSGRALWLRQAEEPLRWGAQFVTSTDQALFSPDGQEVLVNLENDGSLYRLDLDTRGVRVERGDLPGGGGWLSFDDARGLMASVSPDGRGWAWSRAAPTPRELEGTEGGLRYARLVPGGRRLVGVFRDGRVGVWPLQGGAPRLLPDDGAGAERTTVDLSADGLRLVATGARSGARVHDLEGGRELGRLRLAAPGMASCSALDATGARVATGLGDGRLVLWEADTGRVLWQHAQHAGDVTSLAFSPDGARLASGCGDRLVRVFDAGSGQLRAVLRSNLDLVHTVAWSPDGRSLSAVDWAGAVRVYDGQARGDRERLARGHPGQGNTVRFSPDGRTLASADWKGSVRLWETGSGLELRVLHGYEGTLLGFSPDGGQLLTEDWWGAMHLWDARTLRKTRVLGSHAAQVTAAAFDPGAGALVSAAKDGSLRVWHLRTAALREVCDALPAPAQQVGFGAAGEALAAVPAGRALQLWDARACRAQASLGGPASALQVVALDAAAGRAAGVDAERNLWLWERGAGRSLLRLDSPATRVRLHPAGSCVGVAQEDGVVSLVPVDGGAPLRLHGHEGVVWDLAFSPDGALVATTGFDWTVRLWRTDSGRPLWRTAALLAAPGEEARVLTQVGWQAPGRPEPVLPPRAARWLEALAAGVQARESPDGRALCLDPGTGPVQLWDRAADRLLAQGREEGARTFLALAGPACAVQVGERVELVAPDAGALPLPVRAERIGLGRGGRELLVAEGGLIRVFDARGREAASLPGADGAVALLGLEERLALGFSEGHVELRARTADAGSALSLEEVPEHPPTALAAGPGGTLAVGFGNGLVGLWELERGQRLLAAKLHGPIAELRLAGDALLAVSSLGDHLRWELGALTRPRCEALAEVWAAVPVVWERGRPVRRGPPADHACAR